MNALELDVLRALTGAMFPGEPPTPIDLALNRTIRLVAAVPAPTTTLSLVRQIIPRRPSALGSISKS